MLKIAIFEFSLFGINTYVVYDPESRQAAIIDPGMLGIEEENAMRGFIEREQLTVTHLINTHLHIDHAVGNRFVSDRYGIEAEAHPADEPLLQRIAEQAASFGIKEKVHPTEIGRPLKEGDKITIGSGTLEVIHVPGHSPGGIALYDKADGVLFSGDSLFAGSIGRTDLPGGNYEQLVRGIKTKLLSLPPDTVVYPGHGPATTIAREQTANPFLR